jgi:hypothetical protein
LVSVWWRSQGLLAWFILFFCCTLCRFLFLGYLSSLVYYSLLMIVFIGFSLLLFEFILLYYSYSIPIGLIWLFCFIYWSLFDFTLVYCWIVLFGRLFILFIVLVSRSHLYLLVSSIGLLFIFLASHLYLL